MLVFQARGHETITLDLQRSTKDALVFELSRHHGDNTVVAQASIPVDLFAAVVADDGDPVQFLNREFEAYREAMEQSIQSATASSAGR